ncbi:protein YhfH [Alteribacillus sp. HJP-4]
MKRVMEFFRNLPQKQCSDCGEIMEEQHESYMNQCDKCLRHSQHM